MDKDFESLLRGCIYRSLTGINLADGLTIPCLVRKNLEDSIIKGLQEQLSKKQFTISRSLI